MARNVTMKDIADKLSVSKVTVSKALSDKDGVSEELKEKIKALAESMGYRYNASAQAIKSGLSYNIGVIIAERYTDDYRSFYLTIFHYLARELDKYRYSAILNILTDEDEVNLILPRSYYDQKVDAYIILGQVIEEYVVQLNLSHVPILFLDFYNEQTEVDSIVSDNFYGAYGITNYLIKLNHTNIAFVGNIHSTSSIQDRYLGYYKSLLEHKIENPEENVINDRDDKGRFIELKLPTTKPTAFVCNCDKVAYRLIEYLQKNNIKVPEDVSVVGFDNDIYATLSKPQITTVDTNIKEMTETAASIIVDKINKPLKRFGRILIKGTIIYRDSSRAKQT